MWLESMRPAGSPLLHNRQQSLSRQAQKILRQQPTYDNRDNDQKAKQIGGQAEIYRFSLMLDITVGGPHQT